MKKVMFLGLLLGGWLLGGGCSKEDKGLEKFISDEVEITDLEIILPASGKNTESTIITSDHPWSIEGGSDWCTITPRNGEPGTTTVHFTLLPNESYDDRSVTIVLHTSDGDKPLTIYQKKKEAIIFAKDRFDRIPMEGADIEVPLQASVEYRVEIPSANNWITATGPRVMTYGLTSSIETFRVAATQDFAERSGIIVFINTENEKMRDTVTVYQVQRDQIILTDNVVRVPLEGETIRIPVRSNIYYEVSIPEEFTWIHVSSVNQDGVVILVIDESLDQSERTGHIIIRDQSNHALSTTLTIQQLVKETLKFKETSADVPREGDRIQLVVQENLGGKYKIVIPEYAPWITLSQAPEGRAPLADHSVWIKIGENGIDDLAREGRVFVQGTENTDLIDIFVVRQAGGRPPVEDERVTLLAIAEALGGLGTWQDNYKTSWQPENDLENWTSVTVDAATKKHVIKLSLPAPAKGQLPKEIGDLTYLEELVFSTNDVGGKFPPQIANLKQLKSLTLGGNSTSGMKFELVPEFGALTALKTLKVSGGFSGSPGAHVDAIGWLENLESLEMSFGNYGTRMPETWGNLKKLQTLILNEVEFSNIDPVGGMTALRTLWLSDMQKLRSALPESLGNLSELNVLRISNTSLPGLPQSLGNLSKLTELNITGTLITELPASIKDLGELRELTLTNDSLLTALPGSLSGMTRLTSLRITSNKNLAGELPADIGNLAQVSSLNISRNPKLTGKIPESISKLQRLTVLYMDRNAFTGLPASIGEMTNLTGIELQGNDFRDTIPVSIGNLKKLEWLYLYREKKDLSKGLMGPIPESIGEIETLRRIYLQNNQLSGVIPETFSKLNRLLHLYLNDNGLTGNLPGFLAKLPGLTEILLQNNGLSGALPTDFQDATGIQILNLYNNNFEGTIPQGFHGKGQAYTGSTAILDLEMNRLSGTIPEDFLRRAEADSKHFKFRQQKLGFGFTN